MPSMQACVGPLTRQTLERRLADGSRPGAVTLPPTNGSADVAPGWRGWLAVAALALSALGYAWQRRSHHGDDGPAT